MPPIKCVECGAGAKVVWSVELKKTLCDRCVGRLHFPGTVSCAFTVEKIDRGHQGIKLLTSSVLEIGVVVGLCAALWNSGVGNDYFRGTSSCPAVAAVRWRLAHMDTNIFYYFKSSLATNCDIEDSFWRLLLDGWIRGVVTNSDSFLLLLSTLPKAMLFKSMVTVLLRPVCAVIYAVIASLVAAFLASGQDAFMGVVHKLKGAIGLSGNAAVDAGTGGTSSGAKRKCLMKVFTWMQWVRGFSFALWGKLTAKLAARKKMINVLRKMLLAMAFGSSLRLTARVLGFHRLAAFAQTDANNWQLAFEPFAFFLAASGVVKLGNMLDKVLYATILNAPKKPVPGLAPPAPPTFWRERPSKDVVEMLYYSKDRCLRTIEHYKKEAQGILHVLVDDVFYLVVVLRFMFLLFGLSPTLKQLAEMCGLGELMAQQAGLFYDATGIKADDGSNGYLSEWFLIQSFVGARFFGAAAASTVHAKVAGLDLDLDPRTVAWQICWRLFVPVVCYIAETRWEKYIGGQRKKFMGNWQGQKWKGGLYEECNADYGSFWMQVDRDQWDPMNKLAIAKPEPQVEEPQKPVAEAKASK